MSQNPMMGLACMEDKRRTCRVCSQSFKDTLKGHWGRCTRGLRTHSIHIRAPINLKVESGSLQTTTKCSKSVDPTLKSSKNATDQALASERSPTSVTASLSYPSSSWSSLTSLSVQNLLVATSKRSLPVATRSANQPFLKSTVPQLSVD